jgi:hypothetical protein
MGMHLRDIRFAEVEWSERRLPRPYRSETRDVTTCGERCGAVSELLSSRDADVLELA